MMTTTTRKRLCEPFSGPPPVSVPCRPTLLLGLPSYTVEYLGHVLRNDLYYARPHQSKSKLLQPLTDSLLPIIWDFLEDSDLTTLTTVIGGSVIVMADEVYAEGTDQVDLAKLHELAQTKGPFQAIVVDDISFFYEPKIKEFVVQQHQEHDTSVVYMAIEGIFDLGVLNQAFSLEWSVSSYTHQEVQLTGAGKQILGHSAFPFDHKYIKSNFVTTEEDYGQELFVQYMNPADYEDESEYEDGMPKPSPGSPVVTRIVGDSKSVSYFGFVNSSDVSYGAIILRLCYAAQHYSAGVLDGE